MTLREEAEFVLDQVPNYKLSELIHFMYFLRDCPNSMGLSDKPRGRPKDLRGLLKGKLIVSDDFEEGWELVPESEIRELRKKAGVPQKGEEKQEAEARPQEVAVQEVAV